MADPHSLVKALTQTRRDRGYTQKTLAAMVGTAQSVISNIETGVINPPLGTLLRIADALGVDVQWQLQEREVARG